MYDAKYLVSINRVLNLTYSRLIDSKEYWQFFLAQGLLQGLCLSAMFTPSFARYRIPFSSFNSKNFTHGCQSVNHWFLKRRGLALGIVTSGSSVGGVVWPIMIDHLIINVRPRPVPKLCSIFLTRLLGWIWMGPSYLWLYISCSDGRVGYDGKRKVATKNRNRILRIPALQTARIRHVLVS
jgi:MFS family permease